MNKWTFKAKRALASVALASASLAASAVTITAGTDSPYNFNWLFSSPAGDLTGTGHLAISGFNSGLLTVGVTLNNTSTTAGNRLTSFGFGIDPDATDVSFSDVADAGMVNASLDKIPGMKTVEVCAFSGPNCSGGASDGLAGGGSDSFVLLLAGTWGSSVNIDPIGFKYQTRITSYEFTTSSTTPLLISVPEPGTGALAVLGLALLGAGFGMRRKAGGQA